MTEFILGAALGALLLFAGAEATAARAEQEHEKQVRRLLRVIRELQADKQAMAQLFVRSVPEDSSADECPAPRAGDERRAGTMQKLREDWARAMEKQP
jgi:hypothetical protein